MKHSPGFLALVNEAKKNIRECSVREVKDRFDRGEKFQFIDVREDHEFAQDHAAGARHIGRGVLERDVETLVPDKETPLVLYCGGGFRSALAADNIRRMGYTNVLSLDGGWRAILAAGLPVEPEP